MLQMQTKSSNISPVVSNYSNKRLLLVKDNRTNSITIYNSTLEFAQAKTDIYFLSYKWVGTPCKIDDQLTGWIKF